MTRGARRSVWILAAWAAVAVHAASPALCRSCDLPCCHGPATTSHTPATVPGGEPSGSCPLCVATAAAIDHCPVEPANQPCHCQLDARQDQPVSPPKGGVPQFDVTAQAALPAATLLKVPQTLGVSREHLATTLAMPIRPARILFGVWRD